MNSPRLLLALLLLLGTTQTLLVDGCPKKVISLFKKKILPAGKPQPIGCYPDRPSSRDLPTLGGRSTEMSLKSCAATCRNWDTKYMGLQGGNACWCGHSYGNNGPKVMDTDCGLPCSGEPEITCGGLMQNNVYSLS